MAYLRCPRCSTVVDQPESGLPACPECGFGAEKARAAGQQPRGAYAAGMPAGWIPVRLDSFWNTPEAPVDRYAESTFWAGHPRPKDKLPFMHWSSRSLIRMAGTQLGLGFFSVFLIQSFILFQIAFGAPIFEEMFKFGLALLLVAYLPQRMPWLVGWLGVPVALAIGAGFGWMEHHTSYPEEDNLGYLWRVIFHAASTGLSMLLFAILLPLKDTRTRWLAIGPAVLVHYLNNAGGMVVILTLAIFIEDVEAVASAYSLLWVTSLVVGLPAALLGQKALRRWAAHWAETRLRPLPARWTWQSRQHPVPAMRPLPTAPGAGRTSPKSGSPPVAGERRPPPEGPNR